MPDQMKLIDICDKVANNTEDRKIFADSMLVSVRIIIETALHDDTTLDQKKELAKHAISRLVKLQ